jgi:predicted DNA repair protein MutK
LARVFLLALVFTGLAETGWAVELLPRHLVALAGWGRLARWLCAVIGLALAAISVLGQLAPFWFAGVITVGALLLVVEMAPGGFANRP